MLIFSSELKARFCPAGRFTQDTGFEARLSTAATLGQQRRGPGSDCPPLEALQQAANLIPRLLCALGQPAATHLTVEDNLAGGLILCITVLATGHLAHSASALQAVRSVCGALAALLRASPATVRRQCITDVADPRFTWPSAAAGIRKVRSVLEGHLADVSDVHSSAPLTRVVISIFGSRPTWMITIARRSSFAEAALQSQRQGFRKLLNHAVCSVDDCTARFTWPVTSPNFRQARPVVAESEIGHKSSILMRRHSNLCMRDSLALRVIFCSVTYRRRSRSKA